MATVHYQFAQLKRISKRLEVIGNRLVQHSPIPDTLNIAYDKLQNRLGAIYKTVNDLSVSKSVPGMVYCKLDTEISQLSTDITLFGTKVNKFYK